MEPHAEEPEDGAGLEEKKDIKGIFSKIRPPAKKGGEDISAEINALSKISGEDNLVELPRFALHHESSEKLGWDIFMTILIIFTSFVNPLQIGFDIVTSGALRVMEAILDFIYMFDVGLNFRTTIVNKDTKETIMDFHQITRRYLKGWFVLDLLSALPVTLVSNSVDAHSVEKYFLALKLVRTLKLRQLSVITTRVLKRFEDRDFNPAVFRIYLFVLAFVLVLHFIACGYWGVSRLTDPDFEATWTPEEYYLDEDLYVQYARAIYFSFVINSENDMKPQNKSAYTFSTLCLMLALCTNAVIIGSATNLLSNMDTGAVAKKAQLDGVNGFMRFQKVPLGLQRKIRSFYEYLWGSGQDKHSSGLFVEMTDKLKLQLNVSFKKRMLEKVPLFKTCSSAGLVALMVNLSPSIILPGELIVRQGELAESMFFISRGTVRVCVIPEGEDHNGMPHAERYIISLGEGSFFGEGALLHKKNVRMANVRAETFTELQVLHADDFRALCEIFPEFKAAVNGINKIRVRTSDALRKVKTRGKFGGADPPSVRSMRGKEGSRFKRATATVVADNRSVPTMVAVAGSLGRVDGNTQASHSQGASGVHQAASSAVRGVVSRLVSPRQSVSSLAGPPPSALEARTRGTLYDAIVAEEANMSHETALQFARGGGIRRQALVDLENLTTSKKCPVRSSGWRMQRSAAKIAGSG